MLWLYSPCQVFQIENSTLKFIFCLQMNRDPEPTATPGWSKALAQTKSKTYTSGSSDPLGRKDSDIQIPHFILPNPEPKQTQTPQPLGDPRHILLVLSFYALAPCSLVLGVGTGGLQAPNAQSPDGAGQGAAGQ